MISFIIIGRNEGSKLTQCLSSVFETIIFNDLVDAEVLYVDSKSSDDSVERAKAFDKVRIFVITGECNAAIARNIGAKESNGDILFFIDGDMELEKEFISKAVINGKLIYDCVTGHFDDYIYNSNNEFLGVRRRTYKTEIPINNQILKANGGLFLIKKSVWNEVGGMKTKYRRSQDIDLALRLSENKGIQIIRLPAFIAKHHTVEYNNDKRMWSNLIQGDSFYPAMIFRDHLLNIVAWKRLLLGNYTAVLFLNLIISFLINLKEFIFLSAILYLVLIIVNVTRNTFKAKIAISKIRYFFERATVQFIHDQLFWISFFFFYPGSKKMIYVRIK